VVSFPPIVKVGDIKGRLKQTIGEATGDTGLQREGKIDRASAATKDTIGKAAGKIKHIVNPK
jgi:uncharacterized protein YjbJ (UPF0337 family)